jgi:hypothetical protein
LGHGGGVNQFFTQMDHAVEVNNALHHVAGGHGMNSSIGSIGSSSSRLSSRGEGGVLTSPLSAGLSNGTSLDGSRQYGGGSVLSPYGDYNASGMGGGGGPLRNTLHNFGEVQL